MNTSADFEVHPIGTGRQLADLSDKLQSIRDAAAIVLDNVRTFAFDESLKWHQQALEKLAAELDK